MMKRGTIIAVLVLLLPVAAWAGGLEKELRGRWLGAWVVLTTESYSDCTGAYTNNLVHGNLVKSRGHWKFQPGELGKVRKVDLKRSRLNLFVTLDEPVLIPYRDGPFTLYREARCRAEVQVELPRQVVKGKRPGEVEEFLDRVLERYATEDAARVSERFNGRQRQPYPEDYEMTLAHHAAWKAEQTNLALQARLDEAVSETSRLVDRVREDPLYMAGFTQGVEEARAVDLRSCSALMSVDLAAVRTQAARARQRGHDDEVPVPLVEGFQDGKILVYGLAMIRGLPGCFVPVPDPEAVRVSSNR